MKKPDTTNCPAEHAKLGASNAKRWLACPASIRLSEGIPDEPSFVAEEGTAAHELAAKCLLDNSNAREHMGARIYKSETHGVFKVDIDMAAAVQVYLDAVRSTKKALGPNTEMMVEHKFKITDDMWGTNDCCLVQDFGKLEVWDYKHGAGTYVEVKENPQLMYYAYGAMLSGFDVEDVDIVICQPRNGKPAVRIDSDVSEDSIKKWADEVLFPGAEAALKQDSPAHAGDHCRWCPAAPSCPEIARRAQESAGIVFGSKTKPMAPKSMTPEMIAKVMKFQEIYGPWEKAVAEHALSLMKSGVKIPGCKLVRKTTRRSWKDEALAAKALSSYGDKIYAARKLLTPAQMELATKDEKAVEMLSEKKEGSVTVAPLSDKRPEARADAAKVFQKIGDK